MHLADVVARHPAKYRRQGASLNKSMKSVLFIIITASLLGGCWSPNYNKIPLQENDVPYILEDGDYRDNQGVMHPNQHNVWAMSQSDVFDYMTYVRSKHEEPAKRSFVNKIDKKVVIISIAVALVLLLVALVAALKRCKHDKKKEE